MCAVINRHLSSTTTDHFAFYPADRHAAAEPAKQSEEEKIFRDANEANSVLSDTKSRNQYDHACIEDMLWKPQAILEELYEFGECLCGRE